MELDFRFFKIRGCFFCEVLFFREDLKFGTGRQCCRGLSDTVPAELLYIEVFRNIRCDNCTIEDFSQKENFAREIFHDA